MSKRLPRFTHDQHVDFAPKAVAAQEAVDALYTELCKSFPKNCTIMRDAWAAHQRVTELRSSLDNEFHKVSSDAEFHKSGHVYYKLRTALI
jgi:hypothetical protein